MQQTALKEKQERPNNSLKAVKILSLDDKLDKIMEAIVFQQQLLVTTLKAMDSLLAEKNSKIIKV